MMPTIEISQKDFTRLQSLATPFVDTPATVISRLLDFADNGSDNVKPSIKNKTSQIGNTYYSRDLPPLRHTKFLSGVFGGQQPEKSQWNSLVEIALIKAFCENNDPRKVHSWSGANIVIGKKIDQGYAYVSEYDFSYQRVSAEDAAKILVRLAEFLQLDLEVRFEWRDKEDAFKPLETGRIVVSSLL